MHWYVPEDTSLPEGTGSAMGLVCPLLITVMQRAPALTIAS